MQKGFFGKLFDFSFDEFITPNIVSLLYGLAIFITGLGSLSFAFSGFMGYGGGFFRGVFTVILSPLVFLIGVISARIWFEVVIALIKVAENTRHLKKQP